MQLEIRSNLESSIACAGPTVVCNSVSCKFKCTVLNSYYSALSVSEHDTDTDT